MDDKTEIRANAVYTLPEVCGILGVSDATARRYFKSRRLRVSRVGRAYRILGSQLLEALDETPSAPEIRELQRRVAKNGAARA